MHHPSLSTRATVLALVLVFVVLAGVGGVSARGSSRSSVEPPSATPQVGPVDAALVAAGAAPGGPAGTVAGTGAATAAPPATAAVPPVAPAPVDVQRRGGVPCAAAHRIVVVTRESEIRARPATKQRFATLPASSKYLGTPMTAWVQEVSTDGAWGRVSVPWASSVTRSGWVRLGAFSTRSTHTMVVADLSERRLRVYDRCREVVSVPIAVGRPGSPSPRGRFWVTDRVPVPGSQQGSFGSFAFGLSTIQPNLPAGWTGGNQMAIHGTGAPGSIGQAASAGCLRVSEAALAKLRPRLDLGTPVVIVA